MNSFNNSNVAKSCDYVGIFRSNINFSEVVNILIDVIKTNLFIYIIKVYILMYSQF